MFSSTSGSRTSRFRHLLSVTTALCLAAPLLPFSAAAQDASTTDSTAAPPARVGELSNVTGNVSFNGAGSNGQWVAASLNYPISTSDSIFTQPGGQATLAVDSSRLTLAANTELQITSLDQNSLAATESQGEMFLAVSYLQPGQNFTITTPRGTVTIGQNGNYDIAVGDQSTPTVITVLDGAATVTDPGATLQVAAGQSGVLSGTDQTVAQLGTAERDDFMTQMLAQNAPPPPSYAPPVVQQMTGVTALASYGSWSQSSTYGAVWYPSVGSGWAPYREGHWAYVAPWGYTWVDYEPWGFAPFHYGRWIDDGDRWGWVPASYYGPSGYGYSGGGYGDGYQPVYAPAVVSFFGGIGAGIGITIGGLSSGNVGWVPLAPNEPYYPPYGASQNYINRINYVNVHNTTIINNNRTVINNYGNFANRRAATYVPGSAMSQGQAVNRFARPVPADMLAKAQPIAFRPGAQAGGPGAPGGHANAALPPPNFRPRQATAPQLSAFAQRHNLPPAVISHDPAPALRPGQAYSGPAGFAKAHPLAVGAAAGAVGAAGVAGAMGAFNHNNAAHPAQPGQPGMAPALARPSFGANPGFRAPPAPPGAGGAARPGQPGFGAAAEQSRPGQSNAARPNESQPNLPHAFNGAAAPNAAHEQPGAMTGFKAPPAPPGATQRAEGFNAAPHAAVPAGMAREAHPFAPAEARPATTNRPAEAYHPATQPAYHPQAQQAYHPPAAQAYHPPAQQAYHPPAQPAYHPQPQQAFHPAEQQPRPQMQQPTHIQMPQQQFHPAPAAPEPRPEAPRPEPQKHPGG